MDAKIAAIAALGVLLASLLRGGQEVTAAPVSVEIAGFAGYSTEGVKAVNSQIRLFGDAAHDWRYFVEGSASAHGGATTDAFATSYAYNQQFGLLDSYAEKSLRVGSYRGGVRLGRYRSPFGIYSEGDQAYVGFLRSPLIRNLESLGISNTWLEGGVDGYLGSPELQLEVSLGSPQEGVYRREAGLDSLFRVQGYRGPWIVGFSHVTTRPQGGYGWDGLATFDGVDVRWTHAGIQLRGEWIEGIPYNDVRTHGGYVDAIIHYPFMDRVTVVARYDVRALQFSALPGVGSQEVDTRRWVAGAKVRVTESVVGQVNLVHGDLPTGSGQTALDLGITYTWRPR